MSRRAEKIEWAAQWLVAIWADNVVIPHGSALWEDIQKLKDALAPKVDPRSAEAFWARVRKGDGCWEWQGYRYPRGYGRSYGPTGQGYAHRRSWELTHGSVPDGLLVCHTCDNPPCVNPDHLFLGTNLDNIRDRDRKGRGRNGRPTVAA